MDEPNVIEQISVNSNPSLPQLLDDNDYEDVLNYQQMISHMTYVANSYDDVTKTIDSPVVANMNGNIGNIGNTTIDASDTNGNTTGTVSLNGNRLSARLNMQIQSLIYLYVKPLSTMVTQPTMPFKRILIKVF